MWSNTSQTKRLRTKLEAQECLICSSHLIDTSFNLTSAETLCRLLKLPFSLNSKNNEDGTGGSESESFSLPALFQSVTYCPSCVREVSDLGQLLKDLDEVERKLEEGRLHIEGQLKRRVEADTKKDESSSSGETKPTRNQLLRGKVIACLKEMTRKVTEVHDQYTDTDDLPRSSADQFPATSDSIDFRTNSVNMEPKVEYVECVVSPTPSYDDPNDDEATSREIYHAPDIPDLSSPAKIPGTLSSGPAAVIVNSQLGQAEFNEVIPSGTSGSGIGGYRLAMDRELLRAKLMERFQPPSKNPQLSPSAPAVSFPNANHKVAPQIRSNDDFKVKEDAREETPPMSLVGHSSSNQQHSISPFAVAQPSTSAPLYLGFYRHPSFGTVGIVNLAQTTVSAPNTVELVKTEEPKKKEILIFPKRVYFSKKEREKAAQEIAIAKEARREELRLKKLQKQSLRVKCQTAGCSISFPKTDDVELRMKAHVLRKHQGVPLSRRYACDKCPAAFGAIEYLQGHNSTHTGIPEFNCSQCPEAFQSLTTLKAHVIMVHAPDSSKFKCPDCDKVFPTKRRLETHSLIHASQKPYMCEFCSASFSHLVDFKRHQLIKHTDPESNPYKCKLCGKQLSCSNALKTHTTKIHTKDFTVFCDECDYGCTNSKELKAHKMSRHSEVRNFPCSLCPKAFKQQQYLNFHIRCTHNQERPYKCKICGKAFNRPQCLRRHGLQHTKIPEVHPCQICDKVCAQRYHLQIHMLSHSKKKGKNNPAVKKKSGGASSVTASRTRSRRR